MSSANAVFLPLASANRSQYYPTPNKAQGRPLKLGNTILMRLLASRSIRRKDD